MRFTKMEGMVISKASPQTKSSLSPMERDLFRIWTLNGKGETWFKRPPKLPNECGSNGTSASFTEPIPVTEPSYHKDRCNAKYTARLDDAGGRGGVAHEWRTGAEGCVGG